MFVNMIVLVGQINVEHDWVIHPCNWYLSSILILSSILAVLVDFFISNDTTLRVCHQVYSIKCYAGGPHFTNICDTVTNVLLLHPVYQAPSCEPSLILLTRFTTLLAYLNTLLILEMACTALLRHCGKTI